MQSLLPKTSGLQYASEEIGGSSSQIIISAQLKVEQQERRRLEDSQKATQQELEDLHNQVRLMQRVLASQTMTTNSQTKDQSSLLPTPLHDKDVKMNRIFNSNELKTPHQLLSDGFNISQSSLIKLQNTMSKDGGQTNRTLDGFETHYLGLRNQQTTDSKQSAAAAANGRLLKQKPLGGTSSGQNSRNSLAVLPIPMPNIQQENENENGNTSGTAESIKLRMQQPPTVVEESHF